MLTEIECMLAEVRNLGRVLECADLPEGPRVGGVCSTYAEECRAAFTCSYCGSHNLLQCSPYHCAVKRIETSSSDAGGRSGGA